VSKSVGSRKFTGHLQSSRALQADALSKGKELQSVEFIFTAK